MAETGAEVPVKMAAALDAGSLLAGVHRLGVAVSGGADSVALLHLLAGECRRRQITLVALHLNHGLRGGASDGDAAFVRALCAGMGIACEVGRARGLGGKRSKRSGVCQSLEMAAREARQTFFRRVVTKRRLDALAVAHHRDDVAETVLLRLMRGAGAAGLAGMRPQSVSDGLTVIRPLLGIGRETLHAWLRLNHHKWRDDASNSDLTIPRNLVRRTALPFLEGLFGSGVVGGLARSADVLREDDAALDALAAVAYALACVGTGLRVEVLAKADAARTGGDPRTGRVVSKAVQAGGAAAVLSPVPAALRRRVVYRWLLERGGASAAAFETVRRVLAELAGDRDRWSFVAGGGLRIGCRDGVLSAIQAVSKRVGPRKAVARFVRRNGTVTVGGWRVTVDAAVGIVREGGPVGRLPARCTISAEAVRGKRLAVRFRKPGDRIAPLGMSGSRKVQDVLTDAKIPRGVRDTVPLLVCGDEVVWIPGYRVATHYAVATDAAPAWRVTIAASGRV